MARAFDWQSKGQRFDSAILHKKRVAKIATLFCEHCLYLKKEISFSTTAYITAAEN